MDLGGAINGLYEAFASYERPTTFEGCECCWGGAPGASVDNVTHRSTVPAPGGTKPLRELTVKEIADVASEVPLTAGTLDVFKHYLPRIFELAARGEFDWPDIEVVLGRLGLGPNVGCQPWAEWPVQERDALAEFLRALWLDTIATGDMYRVDEVLCGIGIVSPDIEWYLDAWLSSPEARAARTIDLFLEYNADELPVGELANAFWERDDPIARRSAERVIEWAKNQAADRGQPSAT